MSLKNPIIDQSWQTPTLLNSWANYSSSFNPAGYWLDALSIVHFRGVIAGGSQGTTIFTLPAGYRPQNEEAFYTANYSTATGSIAFGRFDVLPNGNVVCQTITQGGTSSAFFMDGFSFRQYA
jgi:hypothetical protein